MLSLRWRLLLPVLALLCLSTIIVSWTAYEESKHEIEEIFDAQLAHVARLLQGTLDLNLNEADRLRLQSALDRAVNASREGRPGHPYESKIIFRAFGPDGNLVLASTGEAEGLLGALIERSGQGREQAFRPDNAAIIGFHDVQLNGQAWRVFVLPPAGEGFWVLSAERDDVRGELGAEIARGVLLPEMAGLVLVVLVWLAVHWGLRPLRQMVDLIRVRDPETLAPLVLPPLPPELEPMAAALNRLLAQVNDLVEHERHFLAAAAHELRTPLAALRIHAQNALKAGSAAERDAALAHLVDGVDRASRILVQLLTFARLDQPDARPVPRRIDLLRFARSELAQLAPLAIAREQDLSLDAPESGSCEVDGDEASLSVLLQNLVGNAIQHAPTGSRIVVSIQSGPDGTTLCVEDDGPGISPARRAGALDPFVRYGDGDGAGLGLSIVRRIAEIHGGQVTLGASRHGGLAATVSLPCHDAQPGMAAARGSTAKAMRHDVLQPLGSGRA